MRYLAMALAGAALLGHSPAAAQSGEGLRVIVWVNSGSSVYHCPGSQFYGATQEGEYMSEAAARATGNRAAEHDGCAGMTTPSPLPGGGRGKVWVNTESGKYYCPTSRSYGRTKRGRYFIEADAKARGFKPSGGRACR